MGISDPTLADPKRRDQEYLENVLRGAPANPEVEAVLRGAGYDTATLGIDTASVQPRPVGYMPPQFLGNLGADTQAPNVPLASGAQDYQADRMAQAYQQTMQTPPEKPSFDWSGALQGFGAGLADAGASLQGRQGTAIANLAQQQQQQAERKALLAEQQQKKFGEELIQIAAIDKNYGDDPDRWNQAMKAMSMKGSKLAADALRVGSDSKYRGQIMGLLDTIQEMDPDFVKQYRTDPRAVSPTAMKAHVEGAAKLQQERANASVEKAVIAGIRKKHSKDWDEVDLEHLRQYNEKQLKYDEQRLKFEKEFQTAKEIERLEAPLAIPVSSEQRVMNQGRIDALRAGRETPEEALAKSQQKPTGIRDVTDETAMAMAEVIGKGQPIYERLPNYVLTNEDARTLKAKYPLVKAGETLRQAVQDEVNRITKANAKATGNEQSEFQKELDRQQAKAITDSRKGADDAVEILNTVREGRKLLASNKMITGFAANFRVGFGQALRAVGFDVDPDPIKNSQAYASNMASNVGKLIKQFGSGTGLSDADREYAEKMAGASIALEKESLEKILAMNDKAARNVIRLHNKRSKGIQSPIPLMVDEPSETGTGERPSKKQVDDLLKKYR